MSENKDIKRPHFYNGLRLSSDEFKKNQEYFSNMRCLKNAVLNTTGIVNAGGFMIEQVSDLAVKITKGRAFYKDENELYIKEIILPGDIDNLDLSVMPFVIDIYDGIISINIMISYSESKQNIINYRGKFPVNIIEKPLITIKKTGSQDSISKNYIIAGQIELQIKSNDPYKIERIINLQDNYEINTPGTERPMSAFHSAEVRTSKLLITDSESTNDPHFMIDDNNRNLHVRADELIFTPYNTETEKIEAVLNGEMNFQGDVTVKGNLIVGSGETGIENETSILSNDMLIKDNIITLNCTENKDEIAGLSGFVINRGNTPGSPYIQWNDDLNRWEAFDPFDESTPSYDQPGEIISNLEEDLISGVNADEHHWHKVLKNSNDPVLSEQVVKVLNDSLNKGKIIIGNVDTSSALNETITVDRNVITDGILFDDSLFPYSLTSKYQQFNDYNKIYTHYYEPGSGLSLQELIADNCSIYIGKTTVLDTAIEIKDIENLSIFCAKNAYIELNDNFVFLLTGNNKNINLVDINIKTGKGFLFAEGNVINSAVKNCSSIESENNACFITTDSAQIDNIIISGNKWDSTGEIPVSINNTILTNSRICSNNLKNTNTAYAVSINDTECRNVNINNNSINSVKYGINITGSSRLLNIYENNITINGDSTDSVTGINIEGNETCSLIKIYSNTININSTPVEDIIGINALNLLNVLISNNVIYLNDTYGTGINTDGVINAIVSCNTFEGIKGFEHIQDELLDISNIAFYELFSFYIKITQPEEVNRKSIRVKVKCRNKYYYDRELTSELNIIPVPDVFQSYTIEVIKSGYYKDFSQIYSYDQAGVNPGLQDNNSEDNPVLINLELADAILDVSRLNYMKLK